MTPAHKQALDRFGIQAQLAKLLEEITELLEVFPAEGEQWEHYNFLSECADVKNVIESINCASGGKVQLIADTKKLRTQIRIRTGYYG